MTPLPLAQMRHPVPSPAPTSPLPARRRHASGPHLGSALEAAPLRSQQNILEVEFKVCVYAGHGAGGVRWLPAAEAEAGVSQELRSACVQRRRDGGAQTGAPQARYVRGVLMPVCSEPPARVHQPGAPGARPAPASKSRP